MVINLKYSNTNTYLIKGSKGYVLFDTGWAGTFDAFCRELGKTHISIDEIKYLFISHFHPDHMGIAQKIAEHNPEMRIVVFEVQKDYVNYADAIFEKEAKYDYKPIDLAKVIYVDIPDGKQILSEVGIMGDVIYTPGHSDDSISIYLESGDLLVGDLNPLYELELHKGTTIYDSWCKLLVKNPTVVYYGHAKTAILKADDIKPKQKQAFSESELYTLVKTIMKYVDKGKSIETISRKTGADKTFIEDVTRMYLTHQNVGVQGILDRIEIKGK